MCRQNTGCSPRSKPRSARTGYVSTYGSILNISSQAALHPSGPAHGISVNVLSPSGIVPTPGVIHHELITPAREPFVEPESVMAAAALALVSGDPRTLTGRIVYSQQILHELGLGPAPLDVLVVSDHARSVFIAE